MSAEPAPDRRGRIHRLRAGGDEVDYDGAGRPAESLVPGPRTSCPHCRGRGQTPSVIRGTRVVCTYCDGIRTVTLEDAKVYLGIRELLRAPRRP